MLIPMLKPIPILMQRLIDANAKTNIHRNDYADTNANDDTNM